MPRRLPLSNPDYEPFYVFVDQKDLRLQRCSQCNLVRFPVSPLCYECLSSAWEWTKVSGRGRVTSWVVFRRQYFDEFPAPYTVVQVELDEGPRLTANLLEFPPEDVRMEMPVRVLYEALSPSRALLQFRAETAEAVSLTAIAYPK